MLSSASAAPFDLNAESELGLGAAGLSAGIVSLVVQSNMPVFTVNDIRQLRIQDINRFDRPAVFLYNERAAECSDYLLFSCAAFNSHAWGHAP